MKASFAGGVLHWVGTPCAASECGPGWVGTPCAASECGPGAAGPYHDRDEGRAWLVMHLTDWHVLLPRLLVGTPSILRSNYCEG